MAKSLIDNVFQDAEDVPTVLRYLVGMGSVCWTEEKRSIVTSEYDDTPPKKVFDEDRAIQAADMAFARIAEILSATPLNFMVNILDSTEIFMAKAGQLEAFDFPADPQHPLRQLRTRMLIDDQQGEVMEYAYAENVSNPVEVADGLLDIIVVAWGSLLAYFGPEVAKRMAAEVARSNLDKVVGEGLPIKREDGKVMKPEGWQGPKIKEILTEAGVLV